eukprot:8288866-Lingulodinium_polyedra.AAC.1
MGAAPGRRINTGALRPEGAPGSGSDGAGQLHRKTAMGWMPVGREHVWGWGRRVLYACVCWPRAPAR